MDAIPSLPLTRALGRFVSTLRFEDLPNEVVEAVEWRVLDLLGASAAGILAGNHEGLLALLAGEGPVPIWGTPEHRTARDAAIINAAVSHSTYFEDGSRYTGGHPSSALIPAALAEAFARKGDGRRAVTAIAAGYEVFLRLGRAIYPSCVRRGFQSTAILAAPATAAACAVLHGLSEERASHAIAIACSHGAGLKEALKAADSQPLQVGRSSEGGLLAARFAAAGATGAPLALENGYLRGFADDARLEGIATDLGTAWHIGETYLKIHGGCRGNHAPVDAAAELASSHGLAPGDIEHIAVAVDTITRAAAIEEPKDGDQAQFSIGFSIAARLVTGDAMPARYTDALLAEPAIRDLMARTTVVADAALDEGYPDRRPALVTFVLRDGRRLEAFLHHARGEPENPVGPADLEKKFMRLAEAVYGPAAAEIRDTALSLASLPSLASFTALLSSAPAASPVPA
ncbi:MmgE/PrpD family protein [Afifella sp. IM 167]|uniref:MmgE/PrpD family protein n=1 Tax=Afifella sp. IM 167 TaxID=2033586 RepID=UPI001CCBC15F